LKLPFHPPQTIIFDPVHTAVCFLRPDGGFVVEIGVQVSVWGSYEDPVS
jgi:hypothetical protein